MPSASSDHLGPNKPRPEPVDLQTPHPTGPFFLICFSMFFGLSDHFWPRPLFGRFRLTQKWGPERWGPEGWRLEGCRPKIRKSGAPKGGAPKGGGPERWGSKISCFFSLSRHCFHSFFLSFGLSWNFGGVRSVRALECARLEFSGCRVRAPAAPKHHKPPPLDLQPAFLLKPQRRA